LAGEAVEEASEVSKLPSLSTAIVLNVVADFEPLC